eukprot:6750038-Pyramimonas_sp.AAC.1
MHDAGHPGAFSVGPRTGLGRGVGVCTRCASLRGRVGGLRSAQPAAASVVGGGRAARCQAGRARS